MKAISKFRYFISTDSDAEEISTMSVDDVQAGLRQFGLQPSKVLPEELAGLLIASRQSKLEARLGLTTWAKGLFTSPYMGSVNLVRLAALLVLVGFLIVAVRQSTVTHQTGIVPSVERTKEKNVIIVADGSGSFQEPKQPHERLSTDGAQKKANFPNSMPSPRPQVDLFDELLLFNPGISVGPWPFGDEIKVLESKPPKFQLVNPGNHGSVVDSSELFTVYEGATIRLDGFPFKPPCNDQMNVSRSNPPR